MIYTIGHSYLTAEEFSSLLATHGVDTVVDIRSMPGSKRSPQFNEQNMREWLPGYTLFPKLGGRRRNKNSDPTINAGWENPSFKSYADYTLTNDYREGVKDLLDLSKGRTVAIMCGEPVPWRCHRLIVSNSLVAQGVQVSHIMPDGSTVEHSVGLYGATPVVHDDHTVTYPKKIEGDRASS